MLRVDCGIVDDEQMSAKVGGIFGPSAQIRLIALTRGDTGSWVATIQVGDGDPPVGSTVMPRAAAIWTPLTTAGLDSASASIKPWDTGAEPSLGISHI